MGGGGLCAPAAARDLRLLVVGDSLSAEYGLRRGTGWVALMEERLRSSSLPVGVVNASVSGETTAGGRSRLPDLLRRHAPTHVVIELGANDALRGLPVKETRANLADMCRRAQAAHAAVLLIGMQVPPNYGAAYGRDFAALFAEVAREARAALVPFLLKGVADDAQALKWFQADRIHPNEAAHPRLLENVWPVLQPWLGAGVSSKVPVRR